MFNKLTRVIALLAMVFFSTQANAVTADAGPSDCMAVLSSFFRLLANDLIWEEASALNWLNCSSELFEQPVRNISEVI